MKLIPENIIKEKYERYKTIIEQEMKDFRKLHELENEKLLNIKYEMNNIIFTIFTYQEFYKDQERINKLIEQIIKYG